ncbi:MAG: protease complex subunit PrcB family protein [Bacillota bacterium]
MSLRRSSVAALALILLIGSVLLPGAAFARADQGKHLGWAVNGQRQIEFAVGSKWVRDDQGEGQLPEAPFVARKGHTVMPVRSIVSRLGGDVQWDQRAKQVIMTFGKIEIVMTVNDEVCLINGRKVEMPIAPVQAGNNGTVFVPVRFLAETLGAEVRWLPNGKIQIISRPREYPELPDDEDGVKQIRFTVVEGLRLEERPDVTRPLVKVVEPADFKNGQDLDEDSIYLAVIRGWCNTSGYGIETRQVALEDGDLVVTVELVDPPPKSLTLPALHYVYQVIKIDAGHAPRFDNVRLRLQSPAAEGVVPVKARLLDRIDLSQRGLITGYGRQLLKEPGELANEFLVVVMRGQCPTGGYGIEVVKFERVDDVVYVWVKDIDPRPGSMVTQAITYPYQIVRAPRGTEGCRFVLRPEKLQAQEHRYQLVNAHPDLDRVDLTERGIAAGYGQDILERPGKWADHYLIVIKRGMCRTGGYGLEMRQLRQLGDVLQVIVREIDPAPEDDVTTALTFPYLIIAVDFNLEGLDIVMVTTER